MTSAEKWEEIKRDYSQSGLFDNACALEGELDRDVAEMLKMAREEGDASMSDKISENCGDLNKTNPCGECHQTRKHFPNCKRGWRDLDETDKTMSAKKYVVPAREGQPVIRYSSEVMKWHLEL